MVDIALYSEEMYEGTFTLPGSIVPRTGECIYFRGRYLRVVDVIYEIGSVYDANMMSYHDEIKVTIHTKEE